MQAYVGVKVMTTARRMRDESYYPQDRALMFLRNGTAKIVKVDINGNK